MKVLICGESGVFCSELIARLKKEKHDIFVITGTEKKEKEKGKGKKTGYQQYDFGYGSKNIRSIMGNVKPDYTIILGVCDTKFSWEEEDKTAVEYLSSMTNLIKSAKDAGIQNVIYCSSLGVYGGQNISEINSNTPMSPTTAVMQTFAQVENVCREQSKPGEFNVSVIRFPEVYGDYGTHSYNICQSIMNSCLFGKKVTIMPEKEHRVIYVKDAVDALMRVLAKGAKSAACFVPGMVV
ncbi:MAG: SDR family oxidoreductase, partial [Clostridia bacterium]|nr:SDR family oxidoreductase [Clostridia bacterium]